MAEAALFSLAGKLLAELASPSFKKAYERVQFNWKKRENLDNLSQTIRIIQAVLLDAEKKQEGSESAAVREWIQLVRDVLYDADDLFDEVATDALLKQLQPKKNTMLSKVRASPSNMFHAVISNDDIAKKVMDIRKRLDEISKEMNRFNFIQSSRENQASVLMEREQTKPFVDEEVVIGRENEKNAILKFLFDDEQCVSVISIVGIGGMGKTTLAQLIYNNEDVQEKFKEKWWTCISDIVGETKVLEKIARSMNKDFRDGSDEKEQISRSIKMGGSYLLVLDDVWDTDLGIWFDIISLLSSGTKGSKIIVTTRFESVTTEFENEKSQICTLNGLSEDMSWELFKKRAFTKKQEKDVQRWTSLGWEIMKKCSNVPLALKSIASLLREKNTIQEWESFNKNELFKIEVGGNSIMSTLKLSYDHLPSNLKNCFAYCSLFPQDHRFVKRDLIGQWIGQGYVQPSENETIEDVGHSYFMELFRKSFFQEAKEDEYGEIISCKMHDLMHDLAKKVAGKECLTLTTGWNQFSKNARHLYVRFDTVGGFENIPQSLLAENRLRSYFVRIYPRPVVPDEHFTMLKLLRCLDLSFIRLANVPRSIGDLKHLRFLNLSRNKFTSLPDSLTKLVNLVTLDISYCDHLRELPNDFRKLINLRHLYNKGCHFIREMPLGFGELISLQHLDWFTVGIKGDCCSGADELARLKLKGKLEVGFKKDPDVEIQEDPNVDKQWKLPKTLQGLTIVDYPGRRIPHWELGNLLPILVEIELINSSTIEHLPPFRYLPYLKCLRLCFLHQLEYVEEEEGENWEGGGHSSTFFPCLDILQLCELDRLKGWSRKLDQHNHPSFPLLSELEINACNGLKSMPFCPRLRILTGTEMSQELTQQLSTSSFTSLETLQFWWMNLSDFSSHTLPSLRRLHLDECSLTSLRHLNVLEQLVLEVYSELELGDVEWDTLPKLRTLVIYPCPDTLPASLQKLIDCGQLQLRTTYSEMYDILDSIDWR